MTRVFGYITVGLLVQVSLRWAKVHVVSPNVQVFLGDDRAVVEREVISIQELLDEQPDSKCEYSLSTSHTALLMLDGNQGAWSPLFSISGFFCADLGMPLWTTNGRHWKRNVRIS